MSKKIVFILILLLFIGLFYSLGKQVYDSLQASSRLGQEAGNLANLQKQNSDLKKKLAQTQSPGFIEQEARDKLNLSRPGETVVMIPQTEIDKVLGAQITPTPTPLPNWQGWLGLFLH